MQFSYFSFIANVFAAAFFVKSSPYYTTYSFTKELARKGNAKRAAQRFEQGLIFFQKSMRPALEAMNAVTFYDQSVQQSAAEYVELAVADAIEYISKIEKIDIVGRDIIMEQLRSAKLSVMFPDEIFNVTKIDGLYDELDFEGSESLHDLSMKTILHGIKLRMKPQESWIGILHKIITIDKPTYFFDENILSKYDRDFCYK